MFKKELIFISLILCIGYLHAQTLTVRIENADVGRGYLMVGVFNDEMNFPGVFFAGEKVSASEEIIIVNFDKLPMGRYAVSVFQDKNNNGQLDSGLFGIPTEKYGFSNGARRPNFNNSSFDFNGNMAITIRIR